MLSFDDERWSGLWGGYKTPFDPRPALTKLENHHEITNAWNELWDGLHHQGDVGEASYAAIPEIVRIHRKSQLADWNTYAITAIIELARTENRNPHVPEWLQNDYLRSIQELAATGSQQLIAADDPDTIRAILSVIAISKRLHSHARFIINYSADELLEMEFKR